MAKTTALSVRVSEQTRRLLADAAFQGGVAGVSALAREILERWAERILESKRKGSLQRAVSYLREHPEGWADDPADFFPGMPPK